MEEEERERKLSSEWANLRRVRLQEAVMLVEAGNLSILSITSPHLFLASATSISIATVVIPPS